MSANLKVTCVSLFIACVVSTAASQAASCCNESVMLNDRIIYSSKTRSIYMRASLNRRKGLNPRLSRGEFGLIARLDKDVDSMILVACPVRMRDVEALYWIHRPRMLAVARVRDEDCLRLVTLQGIEHLTIYSGEVTTYGVALLARIEGLQRIDLASQYISNSDASRIQQLLPEVQVHINDREEGWTPDPPPLPAVDNVDSVPKDD